MGSSSKMVLLCAGCAALIGCHPGGGVPDHYPGAPEVALGTGFVQFTSLTDGDSVPIIHGTQGGYHVWGAARVRYMDPFAIELRFSLLLGAGAPLAVRRDRVDLDGTADGLDPGVHLGTAVVLPDVAAVRGRACIFQIEATDAAGRTGRDRRRIVPEDPPPPDMR